MKPAEKYESDFLFGLLSQITAEEQEITNKRMLLAAKIDKARLKKGWSKKELADRMGKRPSEITKWLSGTHNFTTDTLFNLEHKLEAGFINVGDKPKEQVIRFTLGVSQTVETANSSPLGGILLGKSSVDIYQGEKSSFYAGSSNNKC